MSPITRTPLAVADTRRMAALRHLLALREVAAVWTVTEQSRDGLLGRHRELTVTWDESVHIVDLSEDVYFLVEAVRDIAADRLHRLDVLAANECLGPDQMHVWLAAVGALLGLAPLPSQRGGDL